MKKTLLSNEHRGAAVEALRRLLREAGVSVDASLIAQAVDAVERVIAEASDLPEVTSVQRVSVEVVD